ARTYKTTTREIRRLNGLSDSAELVAGVTVLVPPGKAKSGEPPAEPPLAAVPKLEIGPDQRLVFLVATRATTPRSLSEAFATPWETIVAHNDLDPQARLQGDQVLQVLVSSDFSAEAASVAVYEQSEVEYVIRGSRAHLEASLRRRGLERRAYRARRGDSLKKIAKKFKLTVGDLARINQIKRSHTPERGQLIVIYVAKGRTKGTVAAPPPPPTSTTPRKKNVGTTKPTSSKPAPKSTSKKPARSKRPAKRPRRKPSTSRSSRLPGKRNK
ncbi:MAG: LysM peptidoglycan-binding domain-containing protein, partial [Nannocystaceae bacterium]